MLRSLPGAISIHEGTGYLMLGANLASLTLATSPQPTGMASPKVLGNLNFKKRAIFAGKRTQNHNP